MKKNILVLVLTGILAGCNQPNPTPPPTPPDGNTLFKLYYIHNDVTKEILDGDTIIIDDYEYDAVLEYDQFLFDGELANISEEEDFQLEVSVVRDSVTDGTTDELCLTPSCIPSNGKTTQTFNYKADIFPGMKVQFYAHCSPKTHGDYNIVYNFHAQGTVTPKVEVRVIYRYQ
ncbi:MAG: hypothetical protein LBS16_02950 [Prevotellaceae bacterium]|jgi:hypothetical protein|nr:hypothetical protein [Prevotellaceae bacterium]